METKFGRKMHNFYGPVVSDLKEVGKKSMEWDLNDWRWDGDLFMASPLNSVPTDCGSRQLFPVNGASNSLSDEVMVQNERENRDLEKRRRVDEEAASLNLKLGRQVCPVTQGELDEFEGQNGKKTKLAGAPSNRAVCQVEDCKADLSSAKDYHRRHKVCDVHSKATSCLVGSVMQRFCQQCSRFHVLQEFDEGKRSCRRRLAGHNRRRRKTHPENVVNAVAQNDERGSNYLLISLLRILSNIHSNSSDQPKDQDLLTHLLRNLASLAGTSNERNHAGISPVSQDLQNPGTSFGTDVKDLITSAGPGATIHAPDSIQKRTLTDEVAGGIAQIASTSQSPLVVPTNTSNSLKEKTSDTAVGRTKLNNIDLNYEYDGSQDCLEDLPGTFAPENLGNGGPLWLYKDCRRSSPPQTSGNSGSTSSQSPSTSSGEGQSRTDRIVFKLFGKDPSDFPLVVRKQILDWLSNSPTDIESYIRPGCIILTIYIRMDTSSWDKLYCNLTSSLRMLLNSSTDSFWTTGWIYARVQHRVTFMYNGQVVLDTPSPVKNHQSCKISSIKPVAVTVSEGVQFVVKGFNLSRPTSRLLCSLEGKYLVQQNCADLRGEVDSFIEHDELQSFSFSCVVPNIVGRGFIEVEDHGLSGSFFPFIVAEKDVCSEICTLESIIEVADATKRDINGLELRNQSLDFIHEMGWLLHRAHLKIRLGETSGNVGPFPFERFMWLIEFSIDHDWCAVVKRLLSTLFDGTVDLGQENSNMQALLDMGLVHRAVKRNCRPMVEFLLNYHSSGALGETREEQKTLGGACYLFRPDAVGPGGLTPLHIAASLDSCEDVLDALTEDPGLVGIEAWKTIRDSNGLTPHDYACLRSHYSYIHLLQRKLTNKSRNGHMVINIPGPTVSSHQKTGTFAALESEKQMRMQCSQCAQKSGYLRQRASVRIYRPAMVSIVAIAAVCVCTALLFKSSPEVFCSFHPFRWELLKYGSQ